MPEVLIQTENCRITYGLPRSEALIIELPGSSVGPDLYGSVNFVAEYASTNGG
jgi:hypothetical protein